MSEHIQTITDKAQFQEIFYKFFINNDIFLKAKNGDLKIKFYGYSSDQVAFKIPLIKNMYGSCLIYTRQGDNIVYAQLKFLEKQEDDMHVFCPMKMQIITMERKEDRKSVDGEGLGKKVVYITNIISDFIMENTLSMESRKLDRIRELLKSDIERHFAYIKIFFFNEGASDPRMRHFANMNKPIFISDIHKKPAEKDMEDYNNYMNNVFSKDYYLQNRKQFISETSVPILFKSKIPYGYIQVNNTTPLPETVLSIIKKIAISADEVMAKMKFFPISEEKLLVSDISRGGLGIVFKDRKFIRYFKERCQVFFDLILPDGKNAAMHAEVRNIAILENKIIKIGCEIKEMDALSEVNYEEFLGTMGTEA
jgi:hypothetical protein